MSPLLLHIPHASTHIPESEMADYRIPPAVLRREILRLTDWYADELYATGAAPGQVLRAEVSRLLVDVERFTDDEQELAAKVGMGATYVRTSYGEVLRVLTPERRARLLDLYHRPHHHLLHELAAERLAASGHCLILDAHTYPRHPLPTQPGAGYAPEIGIGTEGAHTPPALRDFVMTFFSRRGLEVGLDTPFRGAMVPGAFHGRDARVRSVMVEVRRDLYMDEASGERNAGFTRMRELLTEFRGQLEAFASGE